MSFPRMHAEQVDSDADLVRRLLLAQHPQWATLAIERIRTDGTDNAIYRLGDELVARLPLIQWAVAQIDKERTWLPRLAPHLPIALPEPVAFGEPGEGYPWPWSVYRWIDGANPDRGGELDLCAAARAVGEFVRTLHALDTTGAPRSQRGVPLATKDADIRGAIRRVSNELDADALLAVWDAALDAPPWDGPPVLVHGDLTDGNILVRDGRVRAVIDFSCFGRADPANDLDVAWDLFSGESRDVYRATVNADDATWARGRGWGICAVYGIPYYERTNPGIVARARHRIGEILAEVAATG